MIAASEPASPRAAGWRKLAALALALAAVGLPVNQLETYALLLLAAVFIFSGDVRASAGAWIAAVAIAAVALAGQFLLAPPRIEEGHNVFLPDAEALQRGLPADVHRQMAQEFDALYPPAVRCKPGSAGCWQDQGRPDKVYAFSADSVWRKTAASRSVTALDFSDPVWLRLGFINEVRYNWYTAAPDVHRNDRDRRFWMGLRRWHLAMPWFEMVRLPAAYVGGEVCWRGEVMWEGTKENFSRWTGDGCRTIEPADAGRRVFGIAVKPDTLAMQVSPPWSVRIQSIAAGGLTVLAVLALVGVLVRLRTRHLLLPAMLILLALLVIAIDDGSLLGGVRPFDGGDDGLFYDGYGRLILQKLLAGDIWGALEGGEKVFYYGGPGLRYFRALEHIVFGESCLGYLSLVLVLPIVVHKIFRRFLPAPWSLALILLFVALPVGVLFGTTFAQYSTLSAKGFADPAAYILFVCAILPLIGKNVLPAFFGALLLALAICMKPIVAPAAAVLIVGAWIAALYRRQWARVAAIGIGFLPVFSMALHNWIYGHVFVLFSTNAGDPNLLVMPPAAYATAARDLLSLNFGGVVRVLTQIAHWLGGPAESYWTIPLNAAGVVILAYVVVRGRQFDPCLRLVGAAALAQHAVALFYRGDVARYHLLTWFLTMLVVMVFMHEVGIGWLQRRYPALSERLTHHPLSLWLASGLTRLQKSCA
ncbi:MAG TPA: hypothetical protein VGF53_16820 [Pseudolabrys sp.]|jgi:hypothetical protein